MKHSRYLELLRQFARDSHLPDTEGLLRTGLIRIDGMDMQLLYEEDAGTCQLRLDLGLPPNMRQDALWPALLASNFIQGSDAVYCLHPASRHVVLIFRLRLDDTLTGRALRRRLAAAGAQARRAWQKVLAALSGGEMP